MEAGGREEGGHDTTTFISLDFIGVGGKKGGEGCLTVEGVLRHQKSHVQVSPSPLRGQAAGKRQPGRGKQERGAAAPTPPQRTDRHKGLETTKTKIEPKKTHSEKPCAPPSPARNQSCLSLQPSPQKNKPKLFFPAAFFFSFHLFFFFTPKVLGFFGLQVADQLGSLSLPLLPPFWAPPMAAASPLTLSPRTAQPSLCRALEDGRRTRPGKFRFCREENRN